MKIQTKFIVTGLIFTISFLSLIIIIPQGVCYESEEVFVAEGDTHVDSGDPTSNFGGQTYLRSGVGIFTDFYEAYFYFDIEDKPSNIIDAEISIYIFGIDKTMKFSIFETSGGWGELAMTWMNKPVQGKLIEEITLTDSDDYTIDVTDEIEDEDDISICVNISNIIDDDYVLIYSKESYDDEDDDWAPKIIFTYEEELDTYDIMLIIIIITIIGALVGVVAFAVIKGTKSKKVVPSQAPVQAQIIHPVPQETPAQPVIVSEVREPHSQTRFCPFCGTSLQSTTQFCQECGQNVND